MIVNFFGPPGCGKSTTATGVFHRLKLLGHNVEYVPEIAKDFTWEERHFALSQQPYIFAKQLRNINRVEPKVKAVITDSPLLLSCFYNIKYGASRVPSSFQTFVRDVFEGQDTMNFFLLRVKAYNPVGRNQTEKESDRIGHELLAMLIDFEVPMTTLHGDEMAVGAVVAAVERRFDADARAGVASS